MIMIDLSEDFEVLINNERINLCVDGFSCVENSDMTRNPTTTLNLKMPLTEKTTTLLSEWRGMEAVLISVEFRRGRPYAWTCDLGTYGIEGNECGEYITLNFIGLRIKL